MTTGSMRKPICFTSSSIVITYLHVKLSTKYRYVRYKISDSSVRYSMFRHLYRIAHLSDVICAIQGCTPFINKFCIFHYSVSACLILTFSVPLPFCIILSPQISLKTKPECDSRGYGLPKIRVHNIYLKLAEFMCLEIEHGRFLNVASDVFTKILWHIAAHCYMFLFLLFIGFHHRELAFLTRAPLSRSTNHITIMVI